jgi:hypothetical protein
MAVFVSVPLAVSPWFVDQFVTAKWTSFRLCAIAWLLVELWCCGSRGWPAFVRGRWPVVLALGALVLINTLRSGVAWGLPVLLDRASFVALAIATYWYFRRRGGGMGPIVVAAGVAAGIVVGWGFGQAFGFQPFASLSAGDQRSASFGNVNMAAQFLGVAVLLLLAGDEGNTVGRRLRLLARVIVVASFAYQYLLACRSVFLGLAGGLVVLLAKRRLTAKALAQMLLAAAVLVLAVLRYAPPDLRHLLDQRVLAEKALSTRMRLDVWRSTLSLIREHPFGAGSGNFGDAFIPYQLALDTIPGDTVLFRTPHNEYLRVVAEEGLVFGAIAGALLVSLFRRARAGRGFAGRDSDAVAFLGAGTVFLVIESLFQFPFGTAFGCTTAAVLLGLALAVAEGPSPPAPVSPGRGSLWLWRGLGTLVAVAILVVAARVATSGLLYARHPEEAGAMEEACRLDPRNLPACVTAAWLKAGAGDARGARLLLLETLRHSPYYHPAIRLLGDVAIADGNREEGCFYLWIYDELFRGSSAVHQRVGDLCGSGRPPGLPAEVPMPFYGTLPAPRREADPGLAGP